MPFPDVERVIYEKTPLVEVICQLRFPRILRVDTELPVDFQESVRDQYPVYREQDSIVMQVEISDGDPVSKRTTTKSYEFLTDDESLKISLSSEAISLTCLNKYQRWEEFREQVVFAFSKLIEIYRPNFFERIGLRYRNIIDIKRLGIEEKGWGEYFSESVTGPYGSSALDLGSLKNFQTQFQIQFTDEFKSQLVANCGLVTREVGKEIGFMIDGDFSSTSRTNGELEDVLARADLFNKRAHQFFRWCIKDELHNQLEPSSIS